MFGEKFSIMFWIVVTTIFKYILDAGCQLGAKANTGSTLAREFFVAEITKLSF